jgi:hypothetical protein
MGVKAKSELDPEMLEHLPVEPGDVIGGKYRVERVLAAGGTTWSG